mgnify:CR=1 FL=1
MVAKRAGEKPGTLLDIGAGTGFFLHFMQKYGWSVTGTEKSDEARRFARDEWNLPLLPDQSLFSMPEQSFDVITLWHVMEHLHDPEKYLAAISRLLKPTGCLFIALPNPSSADAVHYGKYWAAWDVPRHLWHFSPDHICRLLQNGGFRTERMYRMPFDAFYVSILSEKYRKSGFPVLLGLSKGFLFWMASWANRRKCSSLVYLFKK